METADYFAASVAASSARYMLLGWQKPGGSPITSSRRSGRAMASRYNPVASGRFPSGTICPRDAPNETYAELRAFCAAAAPGAVA